jgi:mannitol-specific phosphotransferase system IIBC component
MKTLIALLSLIISAPLLAQSPPFASEDVQALMQKMQGIQTCMQKIDEDALKTMGEEAKKTQEEIETLCDKGKSSQAQKSALEFANKIKNSPELKQVQECVKDMPDMMQGHMNINDMEEVKKKYEKKDICEAIKQ